MKKLKCTKMHIAQNGVGGELHTMQSPIETLILKDIL